MSNNAHTAKFMAKVPATPLRQHIEYLHTMAYYGGIYGSALEMFEHHLYAIAVATAEPPEYRLPKYGNAVVPPMPEKFDASLLTPTYEEVATGIQQMGVRVKTVMREVGENLRRRAAASRASRTPEMAEAISIRRYENAVAAERYAAAEHLRALSYRVRGELRDEIHIHVPPKTGA